MNHYIHLVWIVPLLLIGIGIIAARKKKKDIEEKKDDKEKKTYTALTWAGGVIISVSLISFIVWGVLLYINNKKAQQWWKI